MRRFWIKYSAWVSFFLINIGLIFMLTYGNVHLFNAFQLVIQFYLTIAAYGLYKYMGLIGKE